MPEGEKFEVFAPITCNPWCLENPHPAFLPVFPLEILSCSVGCFLGGQTLTGRCWLSVRLWYPHCSESSACPGPSAAPARCIPRLWSVPVPQPRAQKSCGTSAGSRAASASSLSSLNWGSGPFTEVFCLCPVPALTQTPEEEAVCSRHERLLPEEPWFPCMVQDCASLSLETQEQMGCSSCVSALTWSSFAKPLVGVWGCPAATWDP